MWSGLDDALAWGALKVITGAKDCDLDSKTFFNIEQKQKNLN